MNENKKQVITREIIEKELALKRKSNYLLLLQLLIPLSLYFIFYFYVIIYKIDFADIKSVLEFILLTVAGSVLIVAYLYSLVFFCKTKNYSVALERLHHKRQQAGLGIYASFNILYKLYFVSGLTCSRLELNVFNINDNVAFNEAKESDDFFAVKLNKKVFCVFNTRYFELDEELQKELRN